MPTEVEWALLKAKVEQTEAELRELREETIVSLQAKTDKLCKDFSTVKNNSRFGQIIGNCHIVVTGCYTRLTFY